MNKHPALFLDRDGVFIENRANYVRSWADVEFFPQALDALARIREIPYKIIVVTNQSAVGRGIMSWETAVNLNNRILGVVREANGRIDACYLCPAKPGIDDPCRKPRPGMLLQAAQEHNLDLNQSYMIGDALTDIQAGQAAGVKQAPSASSFPIRHKKAQRTCCSSGFKCYFSNNLSLGLHRFLATKEPLAQLAFRFASVLVAIIAIGVVGIFVVVVEVVAFTTSFQGIEHRTREIGINIFQTLHNLLKLTFTALVSAYHQQCCASQSAHNGRIRHRQDRWAIHNHKIVLLF